MKVILTSAGQHTESRRISKTEDQNCIVKLREPHVIKGKVINGKVVMKVGTFRCMKTFRHGNMTPSILYTSK